MIYLETTKNAASELFNKGKILYATYSPEIISMATSILSKASESESDPKSTEGPKGGSSIEKDWTIVNCQIECLTDDSDDSSPIKSTNQESKEDENGIEHLIACLFKKESLKTTKQTFLNSLPEKKASIEQKNFRDLEARLRSLPKDLSVEDKEDTEDYTLLKEHVNESYERLEMSIEESITAINNGLFAIEKLTEEI